MWKCNWAFYFILSTGIPNPLVVSRNIHYLLIAKYQNTIRFNLNNMTDMFSIAQALYQVGSIVFVYVSKIYSLTLEWNSTSTIKHTN